MQPVLKHYVQIDNYRFYKQKTILRTKYWCLKAKLPQCFSLALMKLIEQWKQHSTHSYSRHYMEVSDQLVASAA